MLYGQGWNMMINMLEHMQTLHIVVQQKDFTKQKGQLAKPRFEYVPIAVRYANYINNYEILTKN